MKKKQLTICFVLAMVLVIGIYSMVSRLLPASKPIANEIKLDTIVYHVCEKKD